MPPRTSLWEREKVRAQSVETEEMFQERRTAIKMFPERRTTIEMFPERRTAIACIISAIKVELEHHISISHAAPPALDRWRQMVRCWRPFRKVF
ncbi:hypothetical protein PFLUV_G00181280 [Perca fluviatilis]|uniref:Uncharacterized protein n=1 Tax=Perca fluviatilis TaxID=8168 RepID=A0A6A5ENH7_PERFL|nr:hypothetical protein PFLUV_G00181280 [Perca fluviatilis]